MVLMLGCGSTTEERSHFPPPFEGMDRRTKLRLASYMVNGGRNCTVIDASDALFLIH